MSHSESTIIWSGGQTGLRRESHTKVGVCARAAACASVRCVRSDRDVPAHRNLLVSSHATVSRVFPDDQGRARFQRLAALSLAVES